MAYRKTEQVISDYFDELLQSDVSDEMAEQEQVAATETPEPDQAKTNSVSEPIQPELAVTKDKPRIADEPSSHEANKVLNEDLPTTAALSESAASDKVEAAPVNPKVESDSTPPIAQGEVQAPTEAGSQLATSSYEEHKLRLEKMLKQVTGLNNPAIATTNVPTAAPTATQAEPLALRTSEEPATETAETIDVATDTNYTPLPVISSEWLENGRPVWGQERFDILLVEVNGLQLAVPLVALGQIQEMSEKLTPLFGQSDWFMGLQESPQGHIRTVNTAKFVMPERYQDEHDYRYVVSINGLPWGLAVDAIHQPITVEPDSIRWRPKRSSRPWMAGMVKDHMCVLLDIPAMGDILQEQDKNHQDSTGG